MSWNDRLYLYAKDRGGTFLGGSTGSWLEEFGTDGVLVTEYRGERLLVRLDVMNSRYSSGCTVRVLLGCSLERPYSLSILPKGGLAVKGINAVLGGVNKLNPNANLYQDYGYPEVTADRRIKTDDPEFTRMVLQDVSLRRVLQENPSFHLRVRPCAPEGLEDPRHVIVARTDLGNYSLSSADEWDMEDVDREFLTPEQRLEAMQGGNFRENLDALLSLAQKGYDAVTAWRMPAKKIDKI